jgi:hypothetical protein
MEELNSVPDKPKRQLSEKEIEAIRAKRAETKADNERKRTVDGSLRRKFKRF